MYGIRTNKGWLRPVSGPKFFDFVKMPCYPFRSLNGAKQIAEDWKLVNYDIFHSESKITVK